MNAHAHGSRPVVTVVAACLVVAATAVCNAGPATRPMRVPTARELSYAAVEAARANDYARAAGAYERARSQPDFAESRWSLSLIAGIIDHYVSQDTSESQAQALQMCRVAEERHLPTGYAHERAMLRLKAAEIYMRQGRLEQARDELAYIRRNLSGRRAMFYADLGDAAMLLLANQPEAAKDRLVPLTELDDPLVAATAMFSLGRAYVQLKQPENATAIFRKLWNRFGESDMVKRAVFLVGQAYFDRGDFLEARKLFEACSAVGSVMQKRVRPGDELVVKVNDANYFSRTRSNTLTVTLRCASGDVESLKLEKNPVSDQLYLGRIRTALMEHKAQDGLLQVGGGDIELTYPGLGGESRRIAVVDDGTINIDSMEIAEPAPRHERSLTRAAPQTRPAGVPTPVLPSARQTRGMVNPGSPVYVQLIDADLDMTDQPDTATVQVVASGGRGGSINVVLTETGPRTGVFAGSLLTANSGPTATASSESLAHPARCAIDIDKNSPAPTSRPASKAVTAWQAKVGDKAPWLEIDLHQPAVLGKLTWGAGDDRWASRNMPTDLTLTLKGDGQPKVIPLANQTQPFDNVVDLKGTIARTLRFDITKFAGEAPAIGQIVLTDVDGNQLIPSAAAVGDDQRQSVLEFNVGQQIFARYLDEKNETPGIPVMRESRRLGARYYNAAMSLVKTTGAGRAAQHLPIWRVEAGGDVQILLNDADLDVTPQPDRARVTVFTETGDKQDIELTETGGSTGIFVSALPLSTSPEAMKNPRMLYIRPGDVLWMSCLDEQNMQPGYKTQRHAYVLENRPTAGSFGPLPMLVTAWPVEVKPQEDEEDAGLAELLATGRSSGQGRVQFTLHDPDAAPVGGGSIRAYATTLIGRAVRDVRTSAWGPGGASGQLDLILTTVDQPRREGEDVATLAESKLPVTGDDIVRLAFVDARIPTADMQMRSVKAPSKEPKEDAATPVVRLSDPSRRVAAAQEAHLQTLKAELRLRLSAYRSLKADFVKHRDQLKKRMPATSATSPGESGRAAVAEAINAALSAAERQIGLLDERVERLAMLAGDAVTTAPTATPPADADDAREALVAGQAFDIVIEDPDLAGPTVDVRIRSLAGRLVDARTVQATRDPRGRYRTQVTTRGPDDEADKSKHLLLVPDGEVLIDYADKAQTPPENVERVAYLALASDAILQATNANYYDTLSQVRLGEPVHVQVVDFDADISDALDQVIVTARSSKGDALIVVLSETEPHSGVFRGKFVTDNGKANSDDDALQAEYSGSIDLVYRDYLRINRTSSPELARKLQITGGTDGSVEGFSRQFRDAREEMRLWYRTGLSAYQIGRRLHLAGAYQRAEEHFIEAGDYFNQLVSKFPEESLAATANYYLGNIQAIRGNHREALARFQEVVTRWPKSEFVPRARFKVGQAFENMGQFDHAADAYVLLTYHHPEDAHVPMAMIRMMNHYARGGQYLDAVGIAQKLVEKFPKHEQAGAAALRAGQWLAVAGRHDEALAWFVTAGKTFAASDKDMPAILYWHAATLIQSLQPTARGPSRAGASPQRVEKVRELLNRIIYDYRTSEYANLARAALDQVRAAERP